MRCDGTVFSAVRSAGRITPRTVTVCHSELICTFFIPSITRNPFGSTRTTRAVMLVFNVVERVVDPWPSSELLPDILARFDNRVVAAGLFTPASEVTE